MPREKTYNKDLVKNPGPKGLWAAPKGAALSSRHRAQGKNNKKELILSSCLAPYTLYLKPLLLAKPLNSDLALKTRFSIPNKSTQTLMRNM
jgi:hypothetical protein